MGEDERVSVLASEQDVHLLREIARWRRSAEITYWRSNGILGRFTQWSEIGLDGRQVSIDFTSGEDDEGNECWRADMTIGRKRELGGVKLCEDDWTLTQAIDTLVAFGYLPQRFSSAYRAGWNAAVEWPAVAAGAVPAVESAW